MNESSKIVLKSFNDSITSEIEEARYVIDNIVNSTREKDRRASAQRRRLLKEDRWAELAEKSIRDRFESTEIANRICGVEGELVDITRNVARDIWKEKAVLYKQHTVRKLENEDDQKKYNSLIKRTLFSSFWQEVEYTQEAFNDVCIWPTVIVENGKKKIAHRIAAPDTMTVIVRDDDPNRVERVVIIDSWLDENNIERKRYYYWTESHRYIFDEELIRLSHETGYPVEDEEPGFENPYGQLPFVFIKRNYFTQYDFWDNYTGDDLIQLSLKISAFNTIDNDLRKLTNHKQIMVYGDTLPYMEGQLLDPSSPLYFQGATNAQIIDFASDFLSNQKLILEEEIRAVVANGISKANFNSDRIESGTAQTSSERKLIEYRQSKVSIYQEAEQHYYDNMIMVCKANGMKDLPKNEDIIVIHASIDTGADPEKQLRIDKEKIKLGLKSVVDLVLAENLGWTREQAEEFIKDNLRIRAEVNEIMANRNLTSNPDVMTRSPEQNGALNALPSDEIEEIKNSSGHGRTEYINSNNEEN